jgi:deoxycytidine triphosphate deaminase
MLKIHLVRLDSEGAIQWWKEKNWDKIGDKVVISPFDEDSLEGCNYNLHIGSEYISLRKHEDPQPLAEGQSIVLDPGETVIILTKENIALPRNLAALIVARARFIQQGFALQATRVDPTWYGKLQVGLTNLSKDRRKIPWGTPFCTMLFFEVIGGVDRVLTTSTTAALGREHIQIPSEYIVPWKRLEAGAVGQELVSALPDQWGPPYDVVRGGYEWTFQRTRQYIEQTWAPEGLKQMEDRAIKEAFRFTKWVTAALIVVLVVATVNILILLLKGI